MNGQNDLFRSSNAFFLSQNNGVTMFLEIILVYFNVKKGVYM